MFFIGTSSKAFNVFRKYCRGLQVARYYSSKKLFGEKLPQRGLLKITGTDSRTFLQGLTTNDVRHLEDGHETSVSLPCIYSMILNIQGRLLYDVLIYKIRETSPIGECLLMECDAEIKEDLVKHLSRYKLRKKVDIKIIDELAVYVLFDETEAAKQADLEKGNRAIIISKDPRLSQLGHRAIIENSKEISDVIDEVDTTQCGTNRYRNLRYSFGVGEGVSELPPGDCFPLECNGDYLHGVSFTKGCYLGQELTSRIHHTGVIRKRIMPFKFDDKVQYEDIPANCAIVNEGDKNVGKFRSSGPVFGIGLLRIDQALAAKTLSVKGFGKITTHKPLWWPQGT